MEPKQYPPLDILAMAAHPDDAELGCGGTLLMHKALGYRIGIADLTRGELGSRGDAKRREQESRAAAVCLQLDYRTQLGLPDGLFDESEAQLGAVVGVIRATRPRVVLANALGDRHPDHGRAAALVARAVFLSGLPKFESYDEGGIQQTAFRPGLLMHYIQDHYRKPGAVVDITDFFEGKMQAVRCYGTQFWNPDSAEPPTPISGIDFFPFLEARAREMGRLIGVTFGEGFEITSPLKISNITHFT